MLNLVSVVITVGCCLIGLSAGIYALAKVRSVGRDGVLTPGLIGVLLNGAFLGIIVLAFLGGLRR